jgi:hypothetical protein
MFVITLSLERGQRVDQKQELRCAGRTGSRDRVETSHMVSSARVAMHSRDEPKRPGRSSGGDANVVLGDRTPCGATADRDSVRPVARGCWGAPTIGASRPAPRQDGNAAIAWTSFHDAWVRCMKQLMERGARSSVPGSLGASCNFNKFILRVPIYIERSWVHKRACSKAARRGSPRVVHTLRSERIWQ